MTFQSCTEGAEFVSEITDADIKKHYNAEVQLSAIYNISVYATKAGCDNSDVATATLCWIDQTPQTEGITNGVAEVKAKALLILSQDGVITVRGADDGTRIGVYGINGSEEGSARILNGEANIPTRLSKGDIAIVKIGEKSVKVMVK